jgi:ribosomal protein L37AE/L43A
VTYAVIVRKKIRMCGRFGHISEPNAARQILPLTRAGQPVYFCQRCGSLVPRGSGGPQ